MTQTKSTMVRTGLATLVLFGAVAMGTTAVAEAKKAPGHRHQGMSKYDKNGDGKIGPLEKQAAITARVQRVFLAADKNGDGQIGRFELRTAPGRLSAWLGAADLNHNGFVTRVELRRFIANQWKDGVHKPWGNNRGERNGNGSRGNGYQGNGAASRPSGWLPAKPAPKPPVVVVRDQRQPAPTPPAVNVRDHRRPKPTPALLGAKRPSVKVRSYKAPRR